MCLAGCTDGNPDGDSTGNISLIHRLNGLTESVEKLKSKNKLLKSEKLELICKNNVLESKLKNIKNSSNSNCKNCLKLKTNLVHLNKNIQKFEKEILILKENKIELSILNNFFQKEVEIFKTDIYSKFEIAENENLVKSGLILKELENVLKNP